MASERLSESTTGKTIRSLFGIVYLGCCFAGILLMLQYVFSDLKFFYGVDYRMFLVWYKKYKASGLFYTENTVFFNFPLTALVFGPWHLMGDQAAVIGKLIQTACLSVFTIVLIFKLSGRKLWGQRAHLFCFLLLALTFYPVQLAYLNIYVEVLTLLLLSLYFFRQGHEWAGALFLALAILFKIFLAPLVLAPLLTRNYRFFLKLSATLIGLILLSMLIYGFRTHLDMVQAITKTYTKMRLFGLQFPYVADGFSGYQDLLNKLAAAGVLSQKAVLPFTLILALFYGSFLVYIFYQIFLVTAVESDSKRLYPAVFGTLILCSITFNFRFDHGLLLLAVLPFFALVPAGRFNAAIIAFMLIVLIRYPLEKLLSFLGMGSLVSPVGRITSFLTFHFIGINLLFWYFASYWTDLYRQVNNE